MTLAVPALDSQSTIIIVGALFAFQLATLIYMLITMRTASRERERINRETFGLLKKVEGLLARKQEKLAKEYDRMLEQMSLQVPVLIAKEAGQEIFETERFVLTRLAELEPNMEDNDEALHKMETIIKTMEGLEGTVISATSKAVEQILAQNRRALFGEDEDDSQAA